MPKPLRPSLQFISKLPTIKIKEEVETTNMVIWKVEPKYKLSVVQLIYDIVLFKHCY